MKFTELEEAAKQRVRNDNYEACDYDWWEYTVSDFVHVCKQMGLDIDTHNKRVCVQFNLFSQGAGAALEGTFRAKDAIDAPARIKEYAPQDAELEAIAKLISNACAEAYGVSYMFNGGSGLRMQIDTRGRSGMSMFVGASSSEFVDSDAETDEVFAVCEKWDEAMLDAAESLCHWLYNKLEDEYNYLTSDENIIERDEDYDEDGCIVLDKAA